jgi:hypothetical protein
MEHPIRTEEYKNNTIKIYLDDMSESPREWDNLGTMACFHRNYILGDIHDYLVEEIMNLVKRYDVIGLPLYLYDHSGITMSTTRSKWPFNCPWDSMQIGYIFVTKEKVRKEFDRKRVTKKLIKKVLEMLRSEVAIYDVFIRGDVIGYEIENGEEGIIDACWGYYNLEHLLEDAKSVIDSMKGDKKDVFLERE